MCRIPMPVYEPDFEYFEDDPFEGMVKQEVPFDGSLSDVGFESDLELFSADPSSYQVVDQGVKDEAALPYLGSVQQLPLDVQGRSWSSNVQQGDDFLSLVKEPPVVTLPVVGRSGPCLPPKPVQNASPLPGSELPSAGQDLEAATFLRMLDQAAGGSAAGLTPWGWAEPSSNRAGNVGSQPTPQQLQSKRLQQAMVMRGGNGAMPGHGRKSREEVAAQVERVKKRRRESAQRSRQRKNEYMKTLEDENRLLKYELAKLRQWVTRMSKEGAPLATSPAQSFSHGSNTNL